ncbi:DUF3850 domain-containing protein [Agrobacterium rhizogenes]|nr:DUF3850 domain-containing protein [Rhizobium rhizogenes]
MVTVHKLKTTDRYFDAIADGRKTFECRKNDRAFQTGDILELQKVDDRGYYITIPTSMVTPVSLRKRITYLLQGGQFGIDPGYCVLGLGEISAPQEDPSQ